MIKIAPLGCICYFVIFSISISLLFCLLFQSNRCHSMYYVLYFRSLYSIFYFYIFGALLGNMHQQKPMEIFSPPSTEFCFLNLFSFCVYFIVILFPFIGCCLMTFKRAFCTLFIVSRTIIANNIHRIIII